jgi:thiamine-phosphate pyrophosphorylase
MDVTALCGLYAIVDPDATRGRPAAEVARAILEGGCAVLQLRAKRMTPAELEPLAREVGALCRAAGVPFVVNDHPALARAVGADGLHVGQDDVGAGEARALVGEALLGVSTHDLAQARAAEGAGADLIGFGPVFATRSKQNPDPVVGLAGLAAVCAAVRIPVVAIGGIELSHARAVRDAGAPLAAAIGAVCGADDPRAAARALHAALGG